MADSGVSSAGGFPFLVLGFLCVFFGIVWWWRHPEIRLRSFPPYPCSDGVSSTGGWHMELFVRQIVLVFVFVGVVSGQSLPI
jgi:hypothetical protein